MKMRQSQADRDRMDCKVMDAIGAGCTVASEIRRFVFGTANTSDSEYERSIDHFNGSNN